MIKTVVLDFGHGGILDGKYTTAPAKMHTFEDGVVAYEGDINRKIGFEIKRCLSEHDSINIVCTVDPDDPTDLSLQERVKIANKYNPKETIFVSIHCNASPNHNASGFELYTSPGETEADKLAEHISKAVSNVLDRYNLRFRKDLTDGDSDKESNFYVLRKTKCPAVLIECLFFDYRPDFDLLNNPEFRGDLGSFIYTGIINYILNTCNN